MLSERATAVAGGAEVTVATGPRDHLSLVGPRHLVWARSIEVADRFEESHVLVVVLELLRTAGHDVVTLGDAVAVGSAHLRRHPTDLVAWRALALLRRALVFLGGGAPGGRRDESADRQSGSRWAISKEKAGRQMETYSAPSGDGVL